MADEFVRTEHFGDFVKRMDERFDHVNELADQRFDSVKQRFLDVEKRMEQGFTHIEQRLDDQNKYVHQRFEQVDKRFDDVQAEIRSLRTIMFALYVPIVVAVAGAIVGTVVKFLFFNN